MDDLRKYEKLSPEERQETLDGLCDRIELETDEMRTHTIRECVTWVAMNHDVYRPEFLAGEMARALLPKKSNS